MTARVTKEIASARALAILRAIADVLEGARKGRSWQAFELEWFGQRVLFVARVRDRAIGRPTSRRLGELARDREWRPS
ncbi:MAG: hypothetical protein IT378_08300 [Sandaracinaceae bacterium]|nr:hypothetical protein [Sandaracinaceae bacterium]